MNMKHWFDKHWYSDGNAVNLLLSGTPFFSELESVIRSATHFLHIQMYIFDDDATGRRVIGLLKEARARGVEVFIVVDAYGSDQLSEAAVKEMKAAGIHFKKFTPIHTSFRFRIGRRLHHKIVLADLQAALIGGINIAEKYEGNAEERAWLDFAVKLQGPVCLDVLRICEEVWGKRMKHTYKKKLHALARVEQQPENMHVRLLQNDWVRGRAEISASYRQVLRSADHSLVIVASYFFPGNRLRRLLRKAAQRGVKIRLVLAGMSDVRFIKPAMDYLYPFLLRNHIEVFEWNRSILHGKIMVMDEKWSSVGSYNVNALSDYGSLELNVGIDHPQFAVDMKKQIGLLIAEGCTQVNADDFKKQHYWWNMFIYWVSYQVVRISQRVLFFFMRR